MLGGIPGTYHLVQAFLKVKFPLPPAGLEVKYILYLHYDLVSGMLFNGSFIFFCVCVCVWSILQLNFIALGYFVLCIVLNTCHCVKTVKIPLKCKRTLILTIIFPSF